MIRIHLKNVVNIKNIANIKTTAVYFIFILWNAFFVALAQAENVRFSNDALSKFNLSSEKIYVSNIKLRQDDSAISAIDTVFLPNVSFQDYLVEKKTAQFKSHYLSASVSRACYLQLSA